MRRTTLGQSGIEVSELCLGTMTWGTQTPPDEAHAQIEAALEAGCDFLDTAEMYPVNPVRAETVGDTETILGDWIARTGRRDEIVVATKMTGTSSNVRDGAPIGPDTLRAACEGSLARLRTDRIDLYQLHWPNRGSYHFRQIWDFDPSGQDRAATLQHMADTTGALAELRDAGKIRAFGLSNDSAWGLMRWNAAADAQGGPRVDTMQNEYSLLCRLYDGDLAEASVHEDCTLLAFSPLAAGFLTGKYRGGDVPEGSRMSLNPEMGGRKTPRTGPAVDAYLDIARRHGIDPVHLALAFCTARPFPTIPIFGATRMDQLGRCLGAAGVSLSDEVRAEIDAANRAHPMPY